MDIIGRDETFSEHGFQVSGFRFQASFRVFTADISCETGTIPSGSARLKATTDNFSHETHEKTRNIIFIFVRFRGFRGQPYLIKKIKFLY